MIYFTTKEKFYLVIKKTNLLKEICWYTLASTKAIGELVTYLVNSLR